MTSFESAPIPVPTIEEEPRTLPETDIEAARLTETDKPWLSRLANKEVDDEWLEETNRLVELGSVNLRPNSNVEPVATQETMHAREAFFGQQLGWQNEAHPLHAAYGTFRENKLRTMPIATVINAQRLMYNYGIDAIKVIGASPSVLNYAPESVREKVDNLQSFGLDAAKVINSLPSALNYAPESMRQKIATLQDLGLDAAKVINTSPSTISYAPESVREKVDNLQSLGIDATVVNSSPKMLDVAPESVRQKIATLQDLGLDAAKVINKLPQALHYAPESIHEKIATLQDLGLDAAKVINTYPQVISRTLESVQKRVRDIRKASRMLGWENDANELIEAFPQMLGFSHEKLLAHARLFAKYGNTALSLANVRTLIVFPLESHIISTSQGRPYDTSNIQRAHRSVPTPDRRVAIAQLLQDKAGLEAKIGQKVVRDYLKYANRSQR